MASKIRPIHPGEVLVDEFLEPLALTPYALAKALGVPQPRIYAITRRERGITADTAMRLARFFGTSEEFWMNLQTHYDLETQRDAASTRRALAKITPLSKLDLAS